MLKIKFDEAQKLEINQKYVTGEFFLVPGKISIIGGENGIGKSSVFQYIRLKQRETLKGLRACFVAQERLTPLNEINFDEACQVLLRFRSEELSFFKENLALISDFAQRPIHNLSGGQNQMIKIMLALFQSGDAFFFDEPLQYLDKKNVLFFRECLLYLKQKNKYICLVEHNRDPLLDLVDLSFEMTCHEQLSIEQI
ncbi:MAG: ATP-binding cassette domain-containing protein [Bacteriovoracaceae bacterium]|jgi:iron complex transport system ATP-binding protein|nr:ATP-binding cassette domain-containing protein [Bacteriovoracaceae bacterium]|tara:strand:+ start:573 stop:1163 length:591 start_codon:yes stop_codon:yes gene_type:complete